MASPVPFKICRCKDPDTGRALLRHCPKLRRPNRSFSPTHGQWAYQFELPPTSDGKRRQLRPSTGFADRQDAQAEIDQVALLHSLAGRDKRQRTAIGDLIQTSRHTTGVLPDTDTDTVRRRLRAGDPLADTPTLAEYLNDWITVIEVDDNTRRTYASHIATHLIPVLGGVPLDQLRPQHIYTLIRAINERNDTLLAQQNSPDPAVRRSAAGRRPTGPATRSRSAPPCAKPSTTPCCTASSPASPIRPPWSRPRTRGRGRSSGNPNACSGG
ncbi:hypothetical protein Acy02nite_47000 [Actinoplanes cyaneus]|uniref:Integrase SAM-like N-terminal domain-containing protein n=1 Tax=Actinoplanes cyaneus TaxID=52696 RepID=A0A919IJC0_9ACTN|nr:N-terminal phage integrase SAM-like domain-containing protein [Actinoplanes cyaneus]MCW2138844.1 Phage integrase, N-terminal SAM-like domain [Actinoplanes cyaneus]GID66819.1 hypothetical protein Acy02nite_47000 [Actinoplanes cyaneus]